MKFFIITKKKLLIVAGFIFVGFLSAFFSLSNLGVFASGKNKKIPIYRVNKNEKIVSLSFDAAWGNEQTQTLLDILKENNIKSTFFLVGMWVDKYPESVKAISDAGHDTENHSDTHPHIPQLSPEKARSQIEECNNKIEKITGKYPTLFRPPYGDYNSETVNLVNELNMHCIQWDVDSLDWKDPSVDEMIKRIKNKIKPGSIILMHNGAKNTPSALPGIIKAIKEDGYSIVPVSELIFSENYEVDRNGTQMLKNS